MYHSWARQDRMQDPCSERRDLQMKILVYKRESNATSHRLPYSSTDCYETKRFLSGLVILWRPVLGLREL